MALRANRFLKFFAILFMLEFLAPALSPGTCSGPGIDKKFQTSSSQAGLFLTLFTEQLNENESGRESYKSLSPYVASYFSFSNLHNAFIRRVTLLEIKNNTPLLNSRPLFRLHCSYLM